MRGGERDFRGETRSNQTHASTTDPDAKLYRKGNGQSSRMAFMGHVLMENRNGLVVGATLTQATGTAECEAALALVDGLNARGRITRHPGDAISLRIRKRIEEVFGWTKATGGLRKTRHKGTARAGWVFTLTAAADNLVRRPKLMAAA